MKCGVKWEVVKRNEDSKRECTVNRRAEMGKLLTIGNKIG